MKKLIYSIFKFHLIPILIAGVLVSIVFVLYVRFKPESGDFQTKVISGKQDTLRGTYANFELRQAEIELAASLKNPATITIFGSSEMSDLKYAPYFFLPDSLNLSAVGFGHAYHQDFSFFCELLAMKSLLPKSKICIILSPGWFETGGTNIEAFLEFVRPDFLRSIIHNDEIPVQYKMEIGRFVSEHYADIDQPAEYLNYFKKLYQTRNVPLLNKEMQDNKKGISKVNYEVSVSPNKMKPSQDIDWNKIENRVQKEFQENCKSNSIFVNDEYFKTVLMDKGTLKKGKTEKIVSPEKNREFKDFLLLVQLLKENNCDASFIIQPLNPYHYNGLENYNETVAALEKVLKQNDFPYLNLFVTDQKKYQPGTLNDVMHLGNYGWMKVNRFLYENYK